MKKVLLVGSQHGNELLGDKLMQVIGEYQPGLLNSLDFYLANPAAHKAGVRQVESDMNRSYDAHLKTYEAQQAQQLLTVIQKDRYSLVIDLHTTNAKLAPCLIVAPQYGATVKEFMVGCEISKVLIMTKKIVEKSLIGVVPEAVSIEVNVNNIDRSFLLMLVQAITTFIDRSEPAFQYKEVFYVDGYIEKNSFSEKAVSNMKNLELYCNSFYPVLVGSNAYSTYKSYIGFRASYKANVTLEV